MEFKDLLEKMMQDDIPATKECENLKASCCDCELTYYNVGFKDEKKKEIILFFDLLEKIGNDEITEEETFEGEDGLTYIYRNGELFELEGGDNITNIYTLQHLSDFKFKCEKEEKYFLNKKEMILKVCDIISKLIRDGEELEEITLCINGISINLGSVKF